MHFDDIEKATASRVLEGRWSDVSYGFAVKDYITIRMSTYFATRIFRDFDPFDRILERSAQNENHAHRFYLGPDGCRIIGTSGEK